MDSNIIKYGIDINYLHHWGVNEALREIYQNFIDYGEYDIDIKNSTIDNNYTVTISNEFYPKDLSFMKIGLSNKREDTGKIGKYGEGLKMALLVLKRNKLSCLVSYQKKILAPIIYIDNNLGDCFGIAVDDKSNYDSRFKIMFDCNKEVFDRFNNKIIKDEDIIFSTYEGSIVNRTPGDIFVGGLFVCNLEKMKYAFDFKPNGIKLDRDRSVPKSFDVEYQASRILSRYEGLKPEDLGSRETGYIYSVDSKLVDKFEPIIKDNGAIGFKSGEFTAPTRLNDSFFENGKMKKKLASMKKNKDRLRKPESILKRYLNRFHITGEQKAEFDIIIKKSKDWVRRKDV